MKNIQQIDSADNCTYSIFEVDDGTFRKIFPEQGQNIEFLERVKNRFSAKEFKSIMEKLNESPIEKDNAMGIHGTLFFELSHKMKFYPNFKESDMDIPWFEKY